MKPKMFLLLVSILLIFVISIAQGCTQISIDREELDLVNGYIKQLGYESKIELNGADDMNKAVNENSKTHEKKSEWELVVDYVDNMQNKNPIELEYSVLFFEDGFSIEDNLVWERIGG